jgi:hypothetical protein
MGGDLVQFARASAMRLYAGIVADVLADLRALGEVLRRG